MTAADSVLFSVCQQLRLGQHHITREMLWPFSSLMLHWLMSSIPFTCVGMAILRWILLDLVYLLFFLKKHLKLLAAGKRGWWERRHWTVKSCSTKDHKNKMICWIVCCCFWISFFFLVALWKCSVRAILLCLVLHHVQNGQTLVSTNCTVLVFFL